MPRRGSAKPPAGPVVKPYGCDCFCGGMGENMKKIRTRTISRHAGMACILALFLCLSGMAAYAAEYGISASDATVVSSRTEDTDVYVYIKGAADIPDGATVQIGNTLCEDVWMAGVVSMGIPIKTTILFDNSRSISKRWGSQAKELIAALIDSHAEGEEYRVATFADGLNVVSDFSTEYESLKAVVEEIAFFDQKSYLTDILYDLLRQDDGSGEANFMRYVIITDGADDNEIKYTQTELSDIMKSSGVVIHTVGVKSSDNNSLLEKLFSYARLTGGTYGVAEGDTDVESIRDMIDEDYSIICLRLNPWAEVMDGSRKEAKLSLNTSNGSVVLTASVGMPFADVDNIQDSEGMESVAPSVSTPAEEEPRLPSIVVESQAVVEPSGAEKVKAAAVMAIAAAVLMVAMVLAAFLVLKSRKKKQIDVVIAGSGGMRPEDGAQNDKATAISAQQNNPVKTGGNTARLGGNQAAGGGGNTLRLQGGSSQSAVRQAFISLTDINNMQRNFRVPIDTRILVGRESGDIQLRHDAAVSYTHCEIIKKGNLFYVNDLKSSNGTFYGGMRVHKETPIMNGGILEVGACKYKITIEN